MFRLELSSAYCNSTNERLCAAPGSTNAKCQSHHHLFYRQRLMLITYTFFSFLSIEKIVRIYVFECALIFLLNYSIVGCVQNACERADRVKANAICVFQLWGGAWTCTCSDVIMIMDRVWLCVLTAVLCAIVVGGLTLHVFHLRFSHNIHHHCLCHGPAALLVVRCALQSVSLKVCRARQRRCAKNAEQPSSTMRPATIYFIRWC